MLNVFIYLAGKNYYEYVQIGNLRLLLVKRISGLFFLRPVPLNKFVKRDILWRNLQTHLFVER